MKTKTHSFFGWIALYLIVAGVLGLEAWNFYDNSDSRLKERFLQLRHGESMSTYNGEFIDKITKAKGIVNLWGKIYAIKKVSEKEMNLFGPDTLNVSLMIAEIEYGPDYYVMRIEKKGKHYYHFSHKAFRH